MKVSSRSYHSAISRWLAPATREGKEVLGFASLLPLQSRSQLPAQLGSYIDYLVVPSQMDFNKVSESGVGGIESAYIGQGLVPPQVGSLGASG